MLNFIVHIQKFKMSIMLKLKMKKKKEKKKRSIVAHNLLHDSSCNSVNGEYNKKSVVIIVLKEGRYYLCLCVFFWVHLSFLKQCITSAHHLFFFFPLKLEINTLVLHFKKLKANKCYSLHAPINHMRKVALLVLSCVTSPAP